MAPLPFPRRIPFVEQLGFELWAFEGGQAELRVDLAEGHLNSWRVAHGGVLMTMLDVAMAHAARSASGAAESAAGDGATAAPDAPDAVRGPGVATIEMKTSFVRAAEGRLRAVGRLLHKTTTLAFCEASVTDDEGRLCAHATGTFKYLRALPTRGRHARPLQAAALHPNQESS
ncbi:MAG: PaaI family thioesterase [Burkholderiales bacterium]|nr:PaaI family thioesterase [Burkholderiales bacterium]MDE2277852.1 PaaI family thioesterase [Burkholderiales bacterium]